MSALNMNDVIKSVRDLPSLPVVVMELMNSLDQTDASVGELADKVSRDQALTAKTLRIANSSFYGLQHKVTTIQQAILVLGSDCIRTLVTAAAVTENFSGSTHATFDFKVFWRHAVSTALCAKMVAKELKLNQDSAFIAGLLHDIGKLVLVTSFPQQYSQAIAYRDSHDCHMLEAERKVLGVDHTVAGLALAEYWKFPVVMQKAIGSHHAPKIQDHGDIPGVIHVADAIAHALDLGGDEHGMVPPMIDSAWDRLNLRADALHTIFRQTETEFEEACQIFSVTAN
jgi:putative nucleotidyltransferase with HDIG domain